MADIRLLSPADAPALQAFLTAHVAQTMLLRGNLLRTGIVDGTQPYQGRYAAAFEQDRIVGVAAFYWNGNLILHAPRHVAAVARAAAGDRRVNGILGPWQQSLDAQDALDLGSHHLKLRSREILMSLTLDGLQQPEPLPTQKLSWRVATSDDIDLLCGWRDSMMQETLGGTPSQAASRESRGDVERWIAEGNQFLLLDDGRPVSGCSFNARLPDAVQLGNVWTPPEWRSRRYARAVVARALEHARKAGAVTAVLFTDRENAAAQTAYVALGFTVVGDYAILLFAD
ncbi:GNAT family N-acetyltransferase [Ferrovibrio terrae]|uniref:GNAT family N-acetyltransferase n=1 Tax=Ferrovibrio terrae TaxID=2594003 RepID=A0A516H5M5_9PROT|nr:GNAT family N-acetyltransferase [Ferrovibrio terrae]QDO99052.1 GNAT family N-acetyltransferase [Ferrovibrio terrae]